MVRNNTPSATADDEVSRRLESAKWISPSDGDIWEDIRLLLRGQSLEVCTRRLWDTFKLAITEGGMQVVHFPLFEFVLEQIASTLLLKPEVRTVKGQGEELAGLWRKWWANDSLARADRLRCAAGYAVLHNRVIGEGDARKTMDLEVLFGEQVSVEPDEYSPLDWGLVRSVTINGDKSDVVYERQEDGSYIGYRAKHSNREPLGTWACCPVTAWYYRPADTLLPSPYSTLRDAHIMTARHLSKAAHDYVYRLNQPWAKGLPSCGRQIRFGAHLLLDLGDEGAVGSLQTQDTFGSGIDGLINALRLVLRLYGLPPEMLGTVSRSETGAARQVDESPLTSMQAMRRTAIDNDVAKTTAQWAAILPPGEIEFVCAKPPPLIPTDKAQYIAGIKAEMTIGLTTPALVMSEAQRIPVTEAQKKVDEALERNRNQFPELFGGSPNGEASPQSD